MKRIVISAIPPEQARLAPYTEPFSGDWWRDGDTLHITVTAEALCDDALLIAVHELVEARLCERDGVPQAAVDAFDVAFNGDGEPGDDPRAPYFAQHRRALLIEGMLAEFLGAGDARP